MDPKDPTAPLDPASLLLPKKEMPLTPRLNAGVLLEQEQKAAFGPQVFEQKAQLPKSEVKEVAQVQPLQTYRGDIEKVVEGGASIVSMAAAEATRRSTQGAAAEPAAAAEDSTHRWKQARYILAGVVLLAAAGGMLGLLLTRSTSVPGPQTPQAPFISVDDTAVVRVYEPLTRDGLMTQLEAARQTVKLPLGLVEWLYPAASAAEAGATDSAAVQEISATVFLQTLAPHIPQTLLRTVQPTYLVGVHSYDQNQAFMIVQVDSYEVAYAGMLEWERTMQGDLLPLFTRTPGPRLQTQEANSTTDSTSSPQASQQFIPTNFTDKVVENRDTRVLLNPVGDIVLLWTMLGRNIVLITTNEYTLREVVSRMSVAPTVPQPGQ